MKTRTSRLEPCPCGSGRRFKECHGKLDQQSAATPFEARHGAVEPLISTSFAGHDVVQIGGKIIVTSGIRHFTAFLDLYLQQLLRPQWMAEQMRLPAAEQHPVVKWRIISLAIERRDEGEMVRMRTGAGRSWFRLAYDLYLIESNSQLQNELVRRIRDPVTFQAARFEAGVAAMMLPAGYDLEFVPARGPGLKKRPEYVATHRISGQRLAVEAKSRHRSGIMGQPGKPTEPERLGVDAQLHKAVVKNTDDPLLIFIELNVPRVLSLNEDPRPIFFETERAWLRQVDRQWRQGFPAIGAVFYNDASPWHLAEQLPDGVTDVAAFVRGTDRHRHSLDGRTLLQKIVEGCYKRLNIPDDHPGGCGPRSN